MLIGKRLGSLLMLALIILSGTANRPAAAAQDQAPASHQVQPGDTWTALAFRYGVEPTDIQAANPHPNPQRQPVIGSSIRLPEDAAERPGRMLRSSDGGLLTAAVHAGVNPWSLARQNELPSPYRPLLYRPLFIPGGTEPPRDLPYGFTSLELSGVPARPGKALSFRGQVIEGTTISAWLQAPAIDPLPFDSFNNGTNLLAVTGTGAFFPPGDHELTIAVDGRSPWSQPWRMVDDEWTYDQIALTGEAAQIDQEAIAAERARLFELWAVVTPVPQWDRPFRLPVDNFLEYSSAYGARRSYNGGPYRSYHEGLDFSAYGGTPVYAPARGTVILAERLYVRGGAVIIDHGLGIYSGFYHMSAVHAAVGQVVTPGDLVGEVGTTGLSTGNHLHWDLLVNGTWVDPAAWLQQDTACWILAGWGEDCEG